MSLAKSRKSIILTLKCLPQRNTLTYYYFFKASKNVLNRICLVVVVVLVVVEVVVGAAVVVVVLVEIRIRGRFRTPVASFGRLSETYDRFCKHFTLVDYSRSKVSSLGIWGQCYKAFYGRKLRLFIIS